MGFSDLIFFMFVNNLCSKSLHITPLFSYDRLGASFSFSSCPRPQLYLLVISPYLSLFPSVSPLSVPPKPLRFDLRAKCPPGSKPRWLQIIRGWRRNLAAAHKVNIFSSTPFFLSFLPSCRAVSRRLISPHLPAPFHVHSPL